MGLCREIRQYTIYSDRQTITVHKMVDVIWADLICRKARYAYDLAKYFSFLWLKIKRIIYSDWA